MTPPPIPLTLVTGPLGSGKTQLINMAMADQRLANTMALANEPGTTSLASDAPELPGLSPLDQQACLCCAGQGRFSALLEALLRGLDNKRIAPFDRLIIETAGEADPVPMLAELIGHPYLGRRYMLCSVVAVLKPDALAATPALARQLECADVAVVRPSAPADLPAFRAVPGAELPVIPMPGQHGEAADVLTTSLFALDRKPEFLRRRIYASSLGRRFS